MAEERDMVAVLLVVTEGLVRTEYKGTSIEAAVLRLRPIKSLFECTGAQVVKPRCSTQLLGQGFPRRDVAESAEGCDLENPIPVIGIGVCP